MKSPSKLLLSALAGLAAPALLVAQTDRTAPNAAFDWNAAGTWSGGATWVSGDNALFGNITAGRTATLSASTAANNINFSNASLTWTIATSNSAVLTLNGTLTKSGAGNATITAPLAGAGTININEGNLQLNSTTTNTFTGPVNLNSGGTLTIGGGNNVSQLGNSVALTIAGGTIRYTGASGSRSITPAITVTGNFASTSTGGAGATDFGGTLNLNGTVDLGSAARTITTTFTAGSAANPPTYQPPTLNFGGTLSGTGGIVKEGNGGLRISGVNTAAQTITVNAGYVEASTSQSGSQVRNAIAGNLTVNSGGTFLLSTVDNIADTSTLTLNSGGTFVFNGGAAARTDRVGALVFNGGSFTNSGTGGGGLALGGSGAIAAGQLAIGSGGVLSGAGTGLAISANSGADSLAVLNAGGSIRPGSLGNANVGTLGIATTQGLTWNGESSSVAQMSFNLGANGVSDQLALTGALTKGGGSNFVFDFLGTGAFGGTYTLLSFSSTSFAVTDFGFTNLGAGLSARNGDGFTNGFRLNADSLEFAVAPIPEPSAFAALAGLGALGLAATRRRRRA